MIKYFYSTILSRALNLALTAPKYFLNTSLIFFAKSFISNKQFLNISFFLYSIASFYKWSKFIFEYKLHTWFIMDNKDLLILKKLHQTKNTSYISAQYWIPGLLSNPSLVRNGARFISAVQQYKINIKQILNIGFFCSCANLALLEETNKYLIPSIVPIRTITSSIFKYFLPLFFPVKKIKNTYRDCWKNKKFEKNKNFVAIIKQREENNKVKNHFFRLQYFKKRCFINLKQIFFLQTRLLEYHKIKSTIALTQPSIKKEWLVYLILFNTLNK